MAAESGTAMAPVEADADPAVLRPDAGLRELPRDGALEDVAVRQADDMVGDEEPGGTVAMPEHNRVDEWAQKLGVERSLDAPVRSSAEILSDRDRRRTAGRD